MVPRLTIPTMKEAQAVNNDKTKSPTPRKESVLLQRSNFPVETNDSNADPDTDFEMIPTEREIEIQQCSDEIHNESSSHPTQAITDLETETRISEESSRENDTVNVTKTRQPREWKIETEVHDIPEFINPIKPKHKYNHETTPIQVFERFFTDYLVQLLVEQTNR